MFGYIKPFIPELKVKHNELYRAVYCGLCKSMGKTTRPVSRLMLSYDFVFLAIFRLAMSGQSFQIKKGRCLLNPLKKRPVMLNNSELEYCSRVCILLSYYSLLDKKQDKGKGRLKAMLLLPFVSSMKQKIKDLCDVEDAIKKSLSALNDVEKSNIPSPDMAAQTFGELTAYVLSRGFEGNDKQTAEVAGLHLGRFIYLADAADDYEKDKRAGDYNPFVAADIDPKKNISMISNDLLLQSNGVYQASLLLDGNEELAQIVENVAEYGMPHTCKEITDKLQKGKVKS